MTPPHSLVLSQLRQARLRCESTGGTQAFLNLLVAVDYLFEQIQDPRLQANFPPHLSHNLQSLQQARAACTSTDNLQAFLGLLEAVDDFLTYRLLVS